MWLRAVVLGLCVIATVSGGGPNKHVYKDFSELEDDYDPVYNFKSLEDPPLSFRLPNTTIPLHYDVLLLTEIHRGDFEFFGTVSIDIRVLVETSSISLHYKQLNISNINLFNSNGQLIQAGVNFFLVPEREFIMLYTPEPLIVNQEYRVVVTYRGELRTDSYGFYRDSYVNEQGDRMWLASTQFQATDARHAFPCYDEPWIRTSFSIRIRHHETYMALSNMPVQSMIRGPIPGHVITSFEKVESMQTYLVAFTVSDFIYAEDASVVPPQRIYAKAESIYNHEYELALEVSPEILLTCEKYFDMNYTFPKMDQVAIANFAPGAMENWGLVSYREPFLLFDPQISTTRDHENILTIISHEFLHQWIGNKVVFEWWTYLWLNEGFATLYEYYMVHHTYPEGRYDDSYLVDVLQRVLEIDANPNIRPMSLYVEDPMDILMRFDWIAYSKAGSVLHTFMDAFGRETWQRGLQRYIRDRYDNYANPRHLYANLQHVVDEDYSAGALPVREMMESWEWQAGFPLLTVEYSGEYITLTQERFFYNPATTSENIWWIPINYVTKSNQNYDDSTFDFWLNTRELILRNDTSMKPWLSGDWLVFNIKQNYYYRVNYDAHLWALITEQLNDASESYDAIHVRNRAQLIDDSYHLARAGRIDYSITIAIMDYLRYDTDYVPWVPANRVMNTLFRLLSGSPVYDHFLKYMRSNAAKIFTKLGVDFIENEHRVDRFSRSIAMNQACRAQLPECLEETNAKLSRHLRANERIQTEYLAATYCNGMRAANGLLFIAMQNKLLQSTLQSERNNIISGMGCSQSEDLLFVLLNLAVTPGIQLTTAEKMRVLNAPATNGPASLKAMIAFTSEHFLAIREITANAISNLLTNIANNIASEEVFTEYDALLQILVVNLVISPIEFNSFRNNARGNLNWQAANLSPIMEFFDSWERPNVV